jgi:hypothetical protein
LKNEPYLKAYILDTRIDASDDFRLLITSEHFWFKLREMKRLLQPIHELQVMSESTHANLHFVYERWMKIKAHLVELSDPNKFYFARDIQAYLNRQGKHGFQFRFERQVQDIHLLAYILAPHNRTNYEGMDAKSKERIHSTIEGMGGAELLEAFFEYTTQEGAFHTTKTCWNHVDNPKLFWNLCVRNSFLNY